MVAKQYEPSPIQALEATPEYNAYREMLEIEDGAGSFLNMKGIMKTFH